MALVRDLVIVAEVGPDFCGAIDIAHEPGTDLGTAKVLGICAKPSAGVLTKIGSGICADHIEQYDREGGFVLA